MWPTCRCWVIIRRSAIPGRSPLEAANLGIQLADRDVAMRCNLVTLSDEPLYEEKTLVDYCAGDIHTADADRLIRALQEAFGGGEFDFYTGTAYPPLSGVAWGRNGAWHGNAAS